MKQFPCPKCGSFSIQKLGDSYQCDSCKHAWKSEKQLLIEDLQKTINILNHSASSNHYVNPRIISGRIDYVIKKIKELIPDDNKKKDIMDKFAKQMGIVVLEMLLIGFLSGCLAGVITMWVLK